MSYSQHINTRYSFNLPFWVMNDEFHREPRVGENTDGNIIEDEILKHEGVTEICLNHQCWVEFETTVPAHKLHDEIEQSHQFLERTLKTFNRQRIKKS